MPLPLIIGAGVALSAVAGSFGFLKGADATRVQMPSSTGINVFSLGVLIIFGFMAIGLVGTVGRLLKR